LLVTSLPFSLFPFNSSTWLVGEYVTLAIVHMQIRMWFWRVILVSEGGPH
jgi:hypothetical protein